MPTDDPATADLPSFDHRVSLRWRSFAGFGLNVIVRLDLGDLTALAGRGPCAYELFLAGVAERHMIGDGAALLPALRAIAAVNGVAGITPCSARSSAPAKVR